MRLLPVALVACLVLGAAAACGRGGDGDGLSASQAADILTNSPGFRTREGSPVGRQLVEVLVVRRIHRTAIEVEFTWRDHPLPPGQTAPLRTSMALFRTGSDGRWAPTALYKAD